MTNITLPRATIEQAMKAMLNFPGDISDEMFESILALRAVLAQQAEPETCTWHQDDDSDSGVYATSCGHYFSITDGTPEDNKMQWCCYCGKKLTQELITEDDDE